MRNVAVIDLCWWPVTIDMMAVCQIFLEQQNGSRLLVMEALQKISLTIHLHCIAAFLNFDGPPRTAIELNGLGDWI